VDDALALQLQVVHEVGSVRDGLMASSPDGPGNNKGGIDPALC
jgi:hypothetical protein